MFLGFLFALFLLTVAHDDVLGASMSSVNVAHPSSALTCEHDADPVDNSTNALSEIDDKKFQNAGLHFKKLEVVVLDEASLSQDQFEYSFLGRLFRGKN